MISRLGLTILAALTFLITSHAQTNNKVDISGNARFAYVSASPDAFDHFSGTSFLRLRVGASYAFNDQSLFKARLATTQSTDFPSVYFTIKPDNGGLGRGGVSFDEFFYQYKNEDTQVKVGRFQHFEKVLSNAGRSQMRFLSNLVNVHWLDGVYVKRQLNEEWYGEFVGEYQQRNNLSFSYSAPLTFSNNKHNFASYLGIENRTRDENNFIQKGFGLFIAPNAYFKPGGFTTYMALTCRIAYDLPKPESLKGGSFRIAAELGQNINTAFKDGTSAVISFGVNSFAEKHELMIEFASNDNDWLTANIFGQNAEEVELRYRYFISSNFNIDFRYRVREPRADFLATNYNFFARATYSF